MVELSEVSIWDANILTDKTYDVVEIHDIIHHVIGGLIVDRIFSLLKSKVFSGNTPQIQRVCDIINASYHRIHYIDLFYQAAKKCELDQFIKYIEPRIEPQYLMMLNGWSYSMPSRIIIQNKMPINKNADFAFLLQRAIQTLAELDDFNIYNAMKSELINFLIKMSYTITDDELYAFISESILTKKQQIILTECLPIKLHDRISLLI
jgi:hypothetical protein